MHRRQLARRGLCLLLALVGGLLVLRSVTAQNTTEEDIWNGPDSDLIARIPVQDATTTAKNEATKTAMEAEEARFMEAAAKTPVVKPVDFQLPTRVVPTPVIYPPHITENGPLPSGWGSIYRITNRWLGRIHDRNVTVLAGSLVDDRLQMIWREPQQGIVIVWVWPPPGSEDNLEQTNYVTPTRSGIVRITSFQDTCLTLTADNTNFQFDAATRTWECSP